MASGDLPADGELQLGPVQLPPGRRMEHCVFCDECAGQGPGSVPAVTAAILDAPIWTFWWD